MDSNLAPRVLFYTPSVSLDVVTRMNRMEPGVHRSKSQHVHAGGKGVVGARAAAGLGQQSAVFTYLTPDSDRFVELASDEGLRIVPILVPGRLRINLAIYCEETSETTIINARPEIEPSKPPSA